MAGQGTAVRGGGRRGGAATVEELSLSAEELAGIRAELEHEAQRLRAEAEVAERDILLRLRDPGDGSGEDSADAGSRTFEREHEMSLVRGLRDALDQVEAALERIERGTYGECAGCGGPVGAMRLQAFPRATLCVACKTREERR